MKNQNKKWYKSTYVIGGILLVIYGVWKASTELIVTGIAVAGNRFRTQKPLTK